MAVALAELVLLLRFSVVPLTTVLSVTVVPNVAPTVIPPVADAEPAVAACCQAFITPVDSSVAVATDPRVALLAPMLDVAVALDTFDDTDRVLPSEASVAESPPVADSENTAAELSALVPAPAI